MGQDEEENVKVAVRVRPFNKREKERKAKLIVDMNGKQTVMTDPSDPKGDKKKFAFDFSYWSHDGGKERADGYWEADPSHPNAKKFCDQMMVYKDLGEGIMKNAWEGYHSTLFAYGQTGSGKSYSVVGYGINKGIIPIFCDQLFQQIDKKKAEGGSTTYEVTFSMIEIYNEVVRDLLNAAGDKKHGLKVRQHPKKGFYAEKQTVVPVDSYKAIEEQMNNGTSNRTIASTNMNATSSRAHTIVGITFLQKTKNAAGKETVKQSVNNLVDLAGSERVASTGATGDRLKEGAAINQSLSALGNVISALADQSQGKKNIKVPYRDSVLTKLLMNALGGNSKTIMIAAISPADINFDESLSTLRYADRAKQIKTKATVNEDPTEKLLRELQEENERLKKQLKSGGVDPNDRDDDDDRDDKQIEEDYAAQLAENDRQMEEMRKSYEEKLAAAQVQQTSVTGKSQLDIQRQRGKYPHFYNLNMDPQLNGMIVHVMKSGKYKIGNQKGDKSDFVLMGPSMMNKHAVVHCSKDQLTVTVERAGEKPKILVNGSPMVGQMALHHNDRVMFGTTQLYVFANPVEVKKFPKNDYPDVDWDMAQEEIAMNSGFDMSRGGEKSEADMILQEELLQVMPAVEEANSISESLDKMVKFEMVLVSPEALGKPMGKSSSEVYVRVRNFTNGIQYEWPKEKFMNRFYKMQELYEDVEEGEVDMKTLPDDQDPFTEPIDSPVRIGVCSVYLKSLAYVIEMKSQLEITDIRGNEVGLLNTELIPCDSKGKEFGPDSDNWIDNPQDLVGKELHFLFKINSARGLPLRFTDAMCKYKIYNDKNETKTKPVPDTNNPDFHARRVVSFKPVTQPVLEYLMEERIMVELWGLQMPIKRDNRGGTTGDLLEADARSRSMVSAANNNTKVIDMGKMKSQLESQVLKKRQEKMEGKILCLREMVVEGERRGLEHIPTSYVRGVLDAPSNDVLDKWKNMYKDTKSDGMANGGGRPSSSRITKSSACVVS